MASSPHTSEGKVDMLVDTYHLPALPAAWPQCLASTCRSTSRQCDIPAFKVDSRHKQAPCPNTHPSSLLYEINMLGKSLRHWLNLSANHTIGGFAAQPSTMSKPMCFKFIAPRAQHARQGMAPLAQPSQRSTRSVWPRLACEKGRAVYQHYAFSANIFSSSLT